MRKFENSRRKRDNRATVKTIFLVTEGKETERLYFKKFRKRGRNVKILFPDSKCTDPINIVNYAVKLSKGKLISNGESFDPGDEIWCIFDVDDIKESALQIAKKLADQNNIEIILSNPSFELWYLLHYEPVSFSLSNDDLMKKLKRYVPEYDKAMDVSDKLEPKQRVAIKYSEQLFQMHKNNNTNIISRKSNPLTLIYKLVDYLNSL